MNDNWKNYLKSDPIPMLLSSNPWTKYRTLTDLVEEPIDNSETVNAKAELLSDNKIIQLATETNNWIVEAATRNNDSKISYFKLQMLADFGLKYTDLNLQDTVEKATIHVIDNMFAVRGQVPDRPKKGEKFEKPDLKADVWHVSPCNSPVITNALLGLGF